MSILTDGLGLGFGPGALLTEGLGAALAAATDPVTGLVAGPVTGVLSDGSYWLYAPAGGNYALEVDDGILAATATGLPASDAVVAIPAQGLFQVIFVTRNSGARVAIIAPLVATLAAGGSLAALA